MTYRRMRACPKCGSDVSRYTYESGWTRVECDGCDYIARPAGTIPQAIAHHNDSANGQGASE